MRIQTCVLIATLLAGGPATPGCVAVTKPAESNLPPGLRDVLWQFLPEEVTAVYVGPDQRLWTVVSGPTDASDPAAVRQMIEREFHSPAPQLAGVRPAFFEKNGRFWFIADRGTLLLAYAGTPGQWIERHTPPEHPFVGNCPGHGRISRAGYNLQLGDRLFFIDGQGVHMYSGGTWEYQQLTNIKYQHTGMESCFDLVPVGPDKGVVALLPRQLEDPWWWHDGQWVQVPLPATLPRTDDAGGKTSIRAGAPFMGDLLLLTGYRDRGFLVLVPLDAGIPKDFDRLAALLAHKSYQVREDATAALIALGTGAARAAEQVLTQPDLDPETQSRLREVVHAAKKRSDGPFEIDGYTPSAKAALWGAPTGDTFIAAGNWRNVENRSDAGERLVVIRPDGTVKTFSGRQYVMCWNLEFQLYAYPRLGPDRRRLYLPGEYNLSPRVLDLETGEITLAPDGNFYWLQAVMADGTAMLSTHNQEQGAVWRPGRPDDRHVLQGTGVPIQGSYGVAPDGTVWAHTLEQGLAQFDGHRWQTRAALNKGEDLSHLLLGAEGTALAVIRTDRGPKRTVFWNGRKLIEGGPLLEFIQQHADLIRSAFGKAASTPSASTGITMAVDKAGRIWVCDGQVHVLDGDQWLEASLPPEDARNPNRPKEVRFVASVGDGSRVYLSSLDLAINGGVAYLAEVRDGDVVLTDAPDCGQDATPGRPIVMPDGTLWLNRLIVRPNFNNTTYLQHFYGTPDVSSEPSETPPAAGKPPGPLAADTVFDVGWGKIHDPGGLLWTAVSWGKERSNLVAVRPGAPGTPSQVLGRIKVPYADTYGMMCASDRAGSIYVWGLSGLHHFSRAAPDRPGDYHLDATYALEGNGRPLCQFNSSGRDFSYTPLGYFLIWRYGDDVDGFGGGSQLFLIPVPGHSESSLTGQDGRR